MVCRLHHLSVQVPNPTGFHGWMGLVYCALYRGQVLGCWVTRELGAGVLASPTLNVLPKVPAFPSLPQIHKPHHPRPMPHVRP